MTRRDPLVVIVGPTGVGKTALALRLAQALDGEIVSADSRQIYRGMNIGTAKPTPAELALVVHHLIDIVDPDQEFTLADFQELACAAIGEVSRRGRLPFLVGGTGQYVRAVAEGWKIPRVPPDPEMRARLYAEAEQNGHQALYQRLLALDPATATFIDARNVRRVVRALEVCIKTGRPFSEQRGKEPPPYSIAQIGLTMEREALYRRVDARIDAMIAKGLVEEVSGLVEKGYEWTLPALSSLGYLQLKEYLEGTVSLGEAVALIKRETRRFIRHQYNWFRLTDRRIHWLNVTQSLYPAALDLIRETLHL
jgi:tRNA dimethylallyltransferase